MNADKFNKNIEMNKKSLYQFIDMRRCSDVNDLQDKAEFGLSILEILESGSARDK